MYNGIGLTTPRGTGTSGHVVRNASALKPGQERGVAQSRYSRYPSERSHPRNKPVDKDILEHERKRQVEIKCLELQDELEEKGLNDGEIEERVDKFRHQLLENIDRLDFSGGRGIQAFEMQKIAAAKSKENHRMAVALHVEDDYVEGAAFDRELQELKRQKRLLARERDRASRKETDSSEQRHRRHYRSPQRDCSRSTSSDAKAKDERSGDMERRHNTSRRHYHGQGDRSRSPMKANVRTVENGEPGEIEDIDADDNKSVHRSSD